MINNVTLVGRLTADGVLKKTPNGKSVCDFNLACQQTKEHTDFIPCTVFGVWAEGLEKYGKKGDVVSVTGKIDVSTYEKEGKTHYRTKVLCNVAKVISKHDGKAKEEVVESIDDIPETSLDITEDELPF